MKSNFDKIIATVENLKTKQAFSDSLASLIQEVTDSTDPSGTIALTVNRTKREFNIPATFLINKLTNMKQNADADVDALEAKIVINA